MAVADHVVASLLLLLVFVVPIIAGKRNRELLARLPDGPSALRLRIYRRLPVPLWAATALIVGLWLYRDYPFTALGFRAEATWRFWLVSGAVILLALFYAALCMQLRRNEKLRGTMRAQFRELGATANLLPRSGGELAYWTPCAISAGLEEIIFRGFALWYLAGLTNLLVAAVISSILFAVGHAYQGYRGIWRAGSYGVVLLLAYLVAGSIWPALVLHIVQDVFAGVAGYLSLSFSGKGEPEKARAE